MTVTYRPLTENQTGALRALAAHGSWSPRDRVWLWGNISTTWRLLDSLAGRGLVLRRVVDDVPIFTVTDAGRSALRLAVELGEVEQAIAAARTPAQCRADAVSDLTEASGALRRAMAALDNAGEPEARRRLVAEVAPALSAVLDSLD